MCRPSSSSEASAVLCTSQVSVTFEDVAVTFTPEEWGQLDQAQQKLYQEVMLDICGLLGSLGKAISLLHAVALQLLPLGSGPPLLA